MASSHDASHGVTKYLIVTAALVILSSASFFTTSDAWPFEAHVGWMFMMAVSCCKALLVILFFMHIKYEADWKYVLTVPASIMSLFMILALIPDVGMRINGRYKQSRERVQHAAQASDVELVTHATQELGGHEGSSSEHD